MLMKATTCEQCKAPTSQANLQPSPDAFQRMVCRYCYKQLQDPRNQANLRKQVMVAATTTTGSTTLSGPNSAKTAIPQATIAEVGERTAKTPMVCIRCNYPFRVDLTKAGVYQTLRCPYCGRADQLQERVGLLK